MSTTVELFDVECPANTPQSTPVEVATTIDPAVVTRVTIVIPDGHSGLTGIALAVAHQPVIPENVKAKPTESWKFIEGNDEVFKLDTENFPDSGQWSAFLFNVDVVPHTWQIRYELRELQPAGVVVNPLTPALPTTPSGEVTPGPSGPEGEAPAPPSGEEGEAPSEGPPPPPPPVTPEPPAEGEPEPPTPVGPPPPPEAEPEPGEPPPTPIGAPPLIEGEGAETPSKPSGAPPGVKPRRAVPKRPTRPAGPTTRVVIAHESRPAGGWLPHGARYDVRREDQGQDLITNWRGKIIAPGDGFVVAILSDRPFPNGFGPRYCVVKITSGQFAGHDWYVGHCTATVHQGEHFTIGHQLALADQGAVEGGGWAEIGEAPGGVPGPMGNGARWHHLFGTVELTHRTIVHISQPKRKAAKVPARHGPPARRTPVKRRPAAEHKPAAAPRRAPSAVHHTLGPPAVRRAPSPPPRAAPAPAVRHAPAPAARPPARRAPAPRPPVRHR